MPSPSEAASLASAFRALRSDGDPSAALRSLDEYERQFPAGVLRNEARVARAEALIALGRREEALPWLMQLGGETDGRTGRLGARTLTRNVRLTRGELLVEAGRCAEATRDFGVLATGGGQRPDGATLRALWGRASCRLHSGETEAARADLELYLALQARAPALADDAATAIVRRALEALQGR
jgi:hypothetical protein